MQHSAEYIASNSSLRLSSSSTPESTNYAVMDESRDLSVKSPLQIPSKASKNMGNGGWPLLSGSGVSYASSDVSLFSASLPVLPHEKLNLNSTDHAFQSVDDLSCSLNKVGPDSEVNDLLEDVEYSGIGSCLPDDEDDLLSGIMEGFHIGLPNQMDDLEDYDVFGSGGGMEIESGLQEGSSNGISRISLSEDGVGEGHYVFPNGVGNVAGEHPYGEHPYGEHPSRTLFVRNINSNVEDSELRVLFEQYGDIRTLYTACKHRGFVMISYYDIRDARTAMKALQNKPLRRRKLDIHFSIPKDNPSDKDINQGTLVVFNLDPTVSNEDLRQIFGAYGEVKEIRETPHKRHHKFIEFYDVRAAEAALRSLNRSDIAGKRIKLEPSRPGGARRSLMVNQSQEIEQDESLNFRHQLGSSIASSPPGSWPQYGSPIEHNLLQNLGNLSGFGSLAPSMGNKFSGIDSLVHPRLSNSSRIPPIGNGRVGHVDIKFTELNTNRGSAFQHSHSFPDALLNSISGPRSPFGVSSSKSPGFDTLSGSQFLWGSPGPYQQRSNSSWQPSSEGLPFASRGQRSNSSSWQTSSDGHPFAPKGQIQGFPYASRQRPSLGSSHHLPHHHAGSAPSGVPVERHFEFFKESSERSFMNSVSFRGSVISHNETGYLLNGSGRVTGHRLENSSPGFRMMPPSRPSPVFLDNGYYPGMGTTGLEGLEHGWGQRGGNSGNQMDNKKQFQLDLEKIKTGEDTRTTLMIKNIPNKYTSKMLMVAIDENHRGTYDFLYLPIDFKNKCNVGYAFINMVSPSHVIPFYQVFNGKRWEKFNSEKVASLAYARIQGKAALVAHFQNSSLMNEDKRCRPIVFHSESSEAGDQGNLPSSVLNIQVHQSNADDSKGSLETSAHEKPNNN